MQAALLLFVIALCGISVVQSFFCRTTATSRLCRLTALQAEKYDEKGYIVKPRDWFNGLSVDPGASLTDPRAVPEECRKFAEEIKAGKEVTLKETLDMIDKHYDYFEVNSRGYLFHKDTVKYVLIAFPFQYLMIL